MKHQKAYGIVYLVLGFGVIGLWVMLLITNQVPELDSTPIEILFHIIVEGIMGVLCLISGFMMLRNVSKSMKIVLVSNGALLYSVINASGYYLENIDIAMLILFGSILLYVIHVSYRIIKI